MHQPVLNMYHQRVHQPCTKYVPGIRASSFKNQFNHSKVDHGEKQHV
jgi:hypothetical protein